MNEKKTQKKICTDENEFTDQQAGTATELLRVSAKTIPTTRLEGQQSDGEDSCDVRINEDDLYLVVYYMFLTLQSYFCWFFTIFINKYE